MNRSANRTAQRRPLRASVNSRSVDDAHRAIVEGQKTIGEISSLVTLDDLPALDTKAPAPMANPDRWRERIGTGAALIDDLPDIAPLQFLPVSVWNQQLFGFAFKKCLMASSVIGAIAGVPIGYALHGTSVHLAMIEVLPFLG